MRLSRSLAPVTLAVALALCAPYEAMPHARVAEETSSPFGAECRTSVSGSHVVAHCHNAYVDIDRVRLHIECDRWWDLDTDSTPVDIGPATTVRLAGRCWKEIRSVWISHQRL
ncbi:hypothetical protein RKD23_005872 [Streptomyces sp. SAI-170]|uniref:hypothetical protein n=1 Tax=Streptomyces sp. SAI-170 TaxID=3377729 RepID=UPI003C7DD626